MGKKLFFLFIIIFILSIFPVFSKGLSEKRKEKELPEGWVVPIDDPLYKKAEELFLCSWFIPPFEDTPVIAEHLNFEINRLLDSRHFDHKYYEEIEKIRGRLKAPFRPVAPVLEIGLSVSYTSDRNLKHVIETTEYDNGGPDPPAGFIDPGKSFIDYMSMYQINKVPSLLKLGFLAQIGPCALLFMPEARPSISELLGRKQPVNIPGDFTRWDLNIPYRGMISCWGKYAEFRFGRDKLQIGPALISSLTVNKNIPYCDYIKVDFHIPWFSISSYLLRLNPIISQKESDYLDDIYNGELEHPEDNTHHEKIHRDRSKHLAIAKMLIRPTNWLSIGIIQHNLIGGRTPQMVDFFPFNIFHNLYEDGLYGVPIMVTLTILPYKGIKLYGSWYFYDAAVADERETSNNATAFAWQAGLTFISTPFFTLGPGRLRIDTEFTLVMPWVYGKYYDLRKFTTRFVYVEPFVGRQWVDYPLGYYLGPDSFEYVLRVSYGKPSECEVMLTYQHRRKGEVDLYGYGDDNDYSNKENFEADRILTGTIEKSHIFTLEVFYAIKENLYLTSWFCLSYIKSRFNQSGNDTVLFYFGIQSIWKIF